MKLIVGKLAGFCGGVINSVSKTDKILNEGIKTYCLGELVHNKQVVDKLRKKGLIVVDSLDNVEDGSRVVIRAHGVPKDVYDLAKKKNLELYDLTCPNVLRIHEKAVKYKEDGYFIVLIAQKDHPEAIGTISFCGDDSIILENEDGIEKVIELFRCSSRDKIAIISQTTYSMAKFEALSKKIEKLLMNNEIVIDNTICSATELRQKETSKIAADVDAMIIIGGKNSSNTKKLYELAKGKCENTFIIETVSDLNVDVSNYETIGVMAGASTPKDSIEELIRYLEEK